MEKDYTITPVRTSVGFIKSVTADGKKKDTTINLGSRRYEIMEHCTKCGCEIHGFLTGRKYVDNKVHCRECYYNELGKVIEMYPVGIPVIRAAQFNLSDSNKWKETKLKIPRFESIIE